MNTKYIVTFESSGYRTEMQKNRIEVRISVWNRILSADFDNMQEAANAFAVHAREIINAGDADELRATVKHNGKILLSLFNQQENKTYTNEKNN